MELGVTSTADGARFQQSRLQHLSHSFDKRSLLCPEQLTSWLPSCSEFESRASSFEFVFRVRVLGFRDRCSGSVFAVRVLQVVFELGVHSSSSDFDSDFELSPTSSSMTFEFEFEFEFEFGFCVPS